MKGHARYRHLRVDWIGELATESITLCGGENELLSKVVFRRLIQAAV